MKRKIPITDNTNELPSADEIAQLAYQYFLERGGETGHDVEDWLRAENELKSRIVVRRAIPTDAVAV